MTTPFTPDRYELREGRFIIVPSSSGDCYAEVDASFNTESEDFGYVARRACDSPLESGYDPYIFEGFIIVDRYDDRACMDVLFGMDREHAEARLAQMKAELENEIRGFINLYSMIAGEDAEENEK